MYEYIKEGKLTKEQWDYLNNLELKQKNMYLDVNQNQVYNLVADMQQSVEQNKYLDLVTKLNCRLLKSESLWIYEYGEYPARMEGCGHTAGEAMQNFYHHFYNQKA